MTTLGMVIGDGIGREIVPATIELVDAAVEWTGHEAINWIELPTGWVGLEQADNTLPEQTRDTLAGLPGWVMGPHDSSAYPQPWRSRLSPHGYLRQHLELFANIRPVRCLPGVNSVVSDMDLVFVRENTEGFYSDRAMHAGSGEIMPTQDVALNVGVFTRRRAEQVAHLACQLAQQRRGEVTMVHKAHVLGLSMGLYLQVAGEVVSQYPAVTLNDVHVDAATVHLVRDPGRFDVLLTENMHGDILSDLAGELAGALGISPSLNASESQAMAQAAHGSAPDIAGKGIANPVGLMFSAGMLLDWMAANGHGEAYANAATRLRHAVEAALREGHGTPDLGREDSTKSFTAAAIKHVVAA